MVADNISGGIEPCFSHSYNRIIQTAKGPKEELVKDYAFAKGVEGKTANEVSISEHVAILALASEYVDSAVSKTCNVGDNVSYEEFKEVYYKAWQEGCKGITTFRASGKRYGILNEVEKTEENETEQTKACFIDPTTGQKECS